MNSRHSRWFRIAAVLCTVVMLVSPVVEAVHTHRGASNDCSICHVAHYARASAATPVALNFEAREFITPVLRSEHRPVFLTEHIFVRPPPAA